MRVRLIISVTANAKKMALVHVGSLHFRAWVRAMAKKNEANEALFQLLAEKLSIPQKLFTIIQGKTAKNKHISRWKKSKNLNLWPPWQS
jgi:uncharacterized protein YggU (UPF0235/DUF167 family)